MAGDEEGAEVRMCVCVCVYVFVRAEVGRSSGTTLLLSVRIAPPLKACV